MSSVFNDSDDFVVLSKPPRAPKRPPKQPVCSSEHASTSTSTVIVGDSLLGTAPKTTSSYWSPRKNDVEKQQQQKQVDHDATCPVCNKHLGHLNDTRRALHINECLDQQEATSTLDSKKTEWSATLDCPLCGEALTPGPHRAAHAKRCGKQNSVPASRLLQLLETQTDIANSRKKRGLPHTRLESPTLESVTKKPKRNELMPRNMLDEQIQMAKALSMSMSSDDSFDFVNPKPFLQSKQTPERTISAPVDCRCAAIGVLHERFSRRVMRKEGVQSPKRTTVSSITEGSAQTEKWSMFALKSAEKMDRLERLSDDLAMFLKQEFAAGGGDVSLISMEGTAVRVHRFILQARCPKLAKMVKDSSILSLSTYPEATLRSYVKFVYSAEMQWEACQLEEIASLARQYGPAGLLALCRKAGAISSDEQPDDEQDQPDQADQADQRDQLDQPSDHQLFNTATDDVLQLVKSTSSHSPLKLLHNDVITDLPRSPTPDWFAHSGSNTPTPSQHESTAIATESVAIAADTVFDSDSFADRRTPVGKSPALQLSFIQSASQENPSPAVNLHKTPAAAAKLIRHRSQPVLGSNVKVLKTTDITPMPNYAAMDTPQIKAELAKYGVRPLGKRKAIPLLNDIYEATHPIVGSEVGESSTPKTTHTAAHTASSSSSGHAAAGPRGQGTASDGDDATLNESFEGEVAEESMMDSEEDALIDPKDVAAMNAALVRWFRLDYNSDLLTRVLALQPISFEEIHSRILRASDVVSTVSKKVLADFLDKQHITFSLPADGWKSKRRRKAAATAIRAPRS